MMENIPVVDISKIGLGRIEDKDITDEDFKDVGDKLHSAFSGVGFAYLSGHGIEDQSIAEAFELWQKFFEDYSVEEKEAAFPRDPVTTQGYVRPNSEMLDVLREEDGEPAEDELRESLDVNRIYDLSPFPDEVMPRMRTVFKDMKTKLEPLALRVYRAVALSLGLDREFFVELHKQMIGDGNSSKLRSLYYPPIKGPVKPGLIRCGEHSDYGTMTFLFQDSIGGLEVKSKSEGWIQATPIKGTILANIGDLMEIWTNGLFPATRHRVVVPAKEALLRTHRQSFVLFSHPDDHVLVEPIHGEEPKSDKYKPVNARKHLVQQFLTTYKTFVPT